MTAVPTCVMCGRERTLQDAYDDGLLGDRPHLADLVARLGAADIVAGCEVLLMWAATESEES